MIYPQPSFFSPRCPSPINNIPLSSLCFCAYIPITKPLNFALKIIQTCCVFWELRCVVDHIFYSTNQTLPILSNFISTYYSNLYELTIFYGLTRIIVFGPHVYQVQLPYFYYDHRESKLLGPSFHHRIYL